MRVGFIGIGNMGGPLARRLLGKVDLCVLDQSAQRMQVFVEQGATACEDARVLAAQVDVVLTCLPSTEALDDEGLGKLLTEIDLGSPTPHGPLDRAGSACPIRSGSPASGRPEASRGPPTRIGRPRSVAGPPKSLASKA